MKQNLYKPPTKKNQGFTIIELMIATAVFSVIILITTASIIYVSKTYIKGQIESQTQLTAQTILADISNEIKYNKGSSVVLPSYTPPNYPAKVNGPFYFCIGNLVYVYRLDTDLSPSYSGSNPMYASHDLVVYNDGSSSDCPAVSLAPQFGISGITSGPTTYSYGDQTRELLAANQRLGQLSVKRLSSTSNSDVFQISIEIAYGEDDVLTDNSLAGTPPMYDSDSHPRELPPGYSSPSPNEAYGYKCVQVSVGGNFCAVSSLTTVVTSSIN